MKINPLSGDYITTLKVRQITNEIELFEIIRKFQTKHTQQADLVVYSALLQLERLKTHNENTTVSMIFSSKEIFLSFCKPFIDLQSSLSLTSSMEDDIINLYNAVTVRWVNKDARCPKSKTINKFRRFIDKNDKEGLLDSVESYIRSSATNNQNLMFDIDNIDSLEIYTIDTLSLLIEEETIVELESLNFTEGKHIEVTNGNLFDIDVPNLKRAGNIYTVQKRKKIGITTGSLFNLVSEA